MTVALALAPLNLQLVALAPIGATLTVNAYGAHAGRVVEVSTVEWCGVRYDRAEVDGVRLHYPACRHSLDLLAQSACARVARPGVGEGLARYTS